MRKKITRESVTTLAEIGGAASMTVGVFLQYGQGIGFIFGGLAAVVLGYLAAD